MILDTETEPTDVFEAMKANSHGYRQQLIKKIKANPASYEQQLQDKLNKSLITQGEYDTVAGLFSELNTYFPSYGLINRGEMLENPEHDTSELRTKEQREANVVFLNSVWSLSVLPDGAPFFHTPGTERTQIETDNSIRPVINRSEGEILAPMGTAYRVTKNPRGGFFAREINSPGNIPRGGHWSSTALAYAYQNHLSKAYQQSPEHTTIEGTTIQRPNHGLAHTYRVMIYIDIVLDYFAHHASDDDFKLFCRQITGSEREWLRVAAAYSVTGRESEISFKRASEEYDQSRINSQRQMEGFLAKYPSPSTEHSMHEHMLDIVRWMGHPGYEQEHQNKPATNQHQIPNERHVRNFTHRILSFAHKLDLPRCYTPQQFNEAMGIYSKCVTSSDEQHADYIRMVQYAIDLIDAHGDCLYSELDSSGELISLAKGYRSPFQHVSSNLRQLRDITQTIPYPKLTEAYQFSSPKMDC